MAGPWVVGGQVDDYALEDRLGAGGMGTVFLARHTGTGVPYALKALQPGGDASDRQRFEREAQAQARVDQHPNVVRIHAVGEAGGRPYLVQDLAAGGDLLARLEGGPLPNDEAARIVRDLARGLAHAHAAGVLHRDLKPANVLFDEQGTPKLVDFGLARIEGRGSLTETGAILGTPAYMAPEQAFADRSQVDAQTDVYGLGAVLYHCLTGRPPFTGEGLAILHRVTAEPPTPPSALAGVDPGLEAICLCALQKPKRRRPRSAAALAEELDRWLRGEAPPTRWGPALAGAALLVAVVALIAAALSGRSPASPAPEPVASSSSASSPPTSTLTATSTPRTLEVPTDELGWVARPRQVEGPGSRTGHAMAYDPARELVVLYGGRRQREPAPTGALHGWDGRVWRELPRRGVLPRPREDHAMAWDPRTRSVAVVGGSLGKAGATSEHWEWRGEWVRSRRRLPRAVRAAALAYDSRRRQLCLFGGVVGDQQLSDGLWLHDAERGWRSATRGGRWPAARASASLAYDAANGRLVLFGGVGTEDRVLSDLWTWDGAAWTEHSRQRRRPHARRGASLVRFRKDRLLLFGGSTRGDGGGGTNDAWILSGTGWSRLDLPRRPAAVRHQALVWFPPRRSFVLYGGRTPEFGKPWPQKTWELRGLLAFSNLGPDALKERAGDTPIDTYRVGLSRLRGKNYVKALELFSRVEARARPGSSLQVLAVIQRARTYKERFRTQALAKGREPDLRFRREAERELKRAERLAPEAIDIHTLRGELYCYAPYRWDRAYAAYLRAAELDPAHVDAWIACTRTAFRLGRKADAQRHLRSAREAAPPGTRAAHEVELLEERLR